MRKQAWVFLWVAVLGLLVTLVFTACEVSSADDPISVSPQDVMLSINESQRFVASGGFEYAWSLSDDTIGVLSTRRGPETVYTSVASHSGTVQVITLTSTVGPTTTTAGSNTVDSVQSVQARVRPRN